MTNEIRKVLVLFAHPSQRRSEINLPLFQASQQTQGVTCVDLYQEYPTYRINIDREQNRLREHDVIVFMFPLYWYSTPAILKEWQDLVLEYGFAYGSQGTELFGKTFLCALTAGGKESAYREEGHNHFTIRQLLQPLEQMANLTGMQYIAPFALFGARTAAEEGRTQRHVEQWRKLLEALVAGRVDLNAAARCDMLNDDTERYIVGASR
uniref:NAD(P)H-dependent oxidoreductase n=1 Tax=Thaumasiovibrio occultus TaxID=1891184 RepID=UPI000B34DC48|nr:NAD(P)H-dependent oxidoreductase [Thaumasiovibrio occultus]